MSETRYQLVFSGQLVNGADPDTVKANLARLFKMDAARVETLFGGKPVVLKKDADQATAMKFRAVMKQAGAQCEMRPVASATTDAPVQESRPPVASSAADVDQGEQNAELETVGTIRTGGTGFSGAFSVADVGSDMDNSERAASPPAPDTSHLSLGQAGEELGQLPDERKTVTPDISHLSLSDD
ncbi:hypothetical protein A11A3_16075 [Alcanivorax hongdengensis A-11-3]|uniref:Uncharacterized protein n=1 Tax=Alcanivorax hongdengensis A-11-3 TaxID=1177179 RepID=L0WA60_9GAMM|nr:hypothetical protein [Alcanivorax hongdengensis]EKF72957.1 hypothetical protein A11A3_16075 [Alcanivorax hongdengensis A-11-3]